MPAAPEPSTFSAWLETGNLKAGPGQLARNERWRIDDRHDRPPMTPGVARNIRFRWVAAARKCTALC
ncbi:MAG: hypothetical protein OXJ64_02680, partial [Boseongicola sp.]|nr:hypothetical protein [Boseongicola sp.]